MSWDLLTRREGYLSKLFNPSWRAKDSPGLQGKFHNPGQLDAQLYSKSLETIEKLTRVGGLTYLLYL